MADLGAACLWMALALATYSFAASIAGQLRGSPGLLDSSRKASYVLVVVLLVSTLSLVQPNWLKLRTTMILCLQLARQAPERLIWP